MQNNPLVSVVMPTFNEPKRIIESSISSILHQTYGNLELLIADDSTNDETIKSIDKFAALDNRVVVIRETERMGLVRAPNRALKQAKGDYIARMDGDDISVANRLEIQLKYFNAHPEVSVLGGAMQVVDRDGNITALRKYPSEGKKLLGWMIARNPFGHPTVMFRSQLIRDGIMYDERMKKGCEDLELWLRLRNKGYKFHNMEDVLLQYRVCEDMTNKRKKDIRQNLKARVMNFSWRYGTYDLASLLFLLVRYCSPDIATSWFYRKENKQMF